ncbi:MAG TPA: O-antigen ligase family protein [Ignavibacteriaceae bacterium]
MKTEEKMLKSRFNSKIIFSLIVILAISFVLSLFVMQLAAGILFILWLFEKHQERKKAYDQIIAFIIIFGLVRLISIFLSEYPHTSYESLYKEGLFYTSAAAIPFYFKTLNKKLILNLMLAFIIGAAVMSLVGSIRFFINDVERAQAFTSSYAVFSSYLLAAFSVALFFPKKIKSNSELLFWSVIYIIILTGIVTSLGRANIAITLLMLLTAIVLKQIPLKQIIILGLFFVIGVSVYLAKPAASIEQRVENITQLSDRDIILQGAKEISLNHPVIGYGPRTFQEIFPFRERFADKGIGGWHNDFLQIYFESGVVGLISFVALLWVIIMMSFNQLRNKKTDAELKSLSASVLASVIALLLSSLFAGFITSVVLSIVFVFLISFISRIDFEISIAQETSN